MKAKTFQPLVSVVRDIKLLNDWTVHDVRVQSNIIQ